MLRFVATLALLTGCGNASSAAVDAAACATGDESAQRHGTACLCCHSDEFGVAGSVDTTGSVARIVVVDATGDVADVRPNEFSNFFRHFPMTPPLRATVYGSDGRSVSMASDAPSGDCNTCHAASGTAPILHGP